MKKESLVVYYSHSGNTGRIAQLIAEATGGDILEIKPKDPYPSAYRAVVAQAKKEILEGYHPPIGPLELDMGGYDMIFVGSPNWWSTLAPPIATFLTQSDLSGKVIAPFCTHGGGGQARVGKDMAGLASGAAALDTLAIYENGGAGAEREVKNWLSQINRKK